MSDPKNEVIESLNDMSELRFKLEVERDELETELKTKLAVAVASLQSEYAPHISRVHAQIDALDPDIWNEAKSNYETLVERGKRSFATMIAKFQFRDKPGTTKVVDAAGIMSLARKLGVIRKIAEPQPHWKLNNKKFLAWLEANPQLKGRFADFIQQEEATETLGLQPNSGYIVHHDSRRISPPSVSIKKS
jgi:phage host-nuclease inhibitor protein Gam